MSEKRELKETLLFEKNHRIHGGIYHKMQVDFAYNSNHIEGSRLTHEQTCYIFETQSVDGAVFVNDVFETANHFRCLDWVLDTISEPLSEEYVKQMHRILKAGLMTQQNPEVVIGDYKKYANVVGGIETAKPVRYPHKWHSCCKLIRIYSSRTSMRLRGFIWRSKRYTHFMTVTAESADFCC